MQFSIKICALGLPRFRPSASLPDFKSIESDILGDGSLDYEADILRKFDLVIASIHSNLKMTEDKKEALVSSNVT